MQEVRKSFVPATTKVVKPLSFRGEGAKFVGLEEPSWPSLDEQREWTRAKYEQHLSQAFTWYMQTQSSSDGYSLALDALGASGHRPQLVAAIKNSSAVFAPTAAWLIRMTHMGMLLRYKEAKVIAKAIRLCLKSQKAAGAKAADKPNIQDHINAKLRGVKGAIDGAFDKFIESGYKTTTKSIFDILSSPEVSAPSNRTKDLVEYAQHYLDEYRAAQSGKKTDADFAEAYAPLGKRNLKAATTWWEQAISDIDKYAHTRMATRAVRVSKPKPPSKIVSKLKYLKTFPDLGLTSVDPTQILKSTELWVFDTRSRKLSHYVAVAGATLEVKGTRILNLDTVKSVQKTLRKPAEQLKQFAMYGKPGRVKWFSNIRAVTTPTKETIKATSILLLAVK